MSANYSEFCDDLLVAIADEQEPPGLAAVEIGAVCERARLDAQDTWIQLAGKDLADRGLGEMYSTWGGGMFLINGAGLRHADEVRASRTDPLDEALKISSEKSGINWTKWGAIAAALAIPTMIILWWLTD